MIKRANQKKKKGFSLIELIIVLAVMAIIALIAIPNFTAVRENSKVKADDRSCETIERTVMMLVADETLTGAGTVTYDTTAKTVITEEGTLASTSTDVARDTVEELLNEALKEVKDPQGKDKEKFEIVVSDTGVAVTTIAGE